MKKTLTINLNGSVFHIDEDAFQLLENYLNNLRNYFRKEEGNNEIMSDFEARIEEIFSQKIADGYNVINIDDVEKVIAQMGKPDDFDEKSDNQTSGNQHFNNQNQNGSAQQPRKKLYRNSDDKMLGGVCSGAAAFFGLDATIVRIVVFALAWLWGTGILLYFVLWLIVPEAITAEQKLEMRGEPINLENIGKIVSDKAQMLGNEVNNAYKTATANNKAATFLKIILIFFGIFAAAVGLSVVLGLLVAAVALIFTGEWFVFQANGIFHSIFWLSVALVCLIPAVGMFVGGMRLIKNRQNLGNLQKTRRKSIFGWLMLTFWVISLLVLIACAITGDKLGINYNKNIDWNKNWFGITSVNTLKGDGNIIKNEDFFDSGKFINNIDFRGIDFNIEIDTQSGKSGIVFVGDSNILEKIVVNTYIYGTRADAEIFPQANTRFNPTQPLKMILYTNRVKKINLDGSASLNVINGFRTDTINILCEGSGNLKFAKIVADKMQIRLRGSGDINVSAECKNSVVNLNGSGDIKLNGKSVSSEFNLYGSGNVSASEFLSDTISAQIAGSGNIHCNPLNLLKTTIIGSGDIYYTNKARVENTNSVGSGRIIKE